MSPPFQVLVLNDQACATGGSASVAIVSAMELARRGIPTTYFAGTGPIDPRLEETERLRVICLGEREFLDRPGRFRAGLSGWRNRRAVAALRSELARLDPRRTVVHAHSWTKALSPFALSAALDAGFRVVVTLHDFFLACPSGGFFVHRSAVLCARRPLSISCLACNCDRRSYAHKLWRSARTLLQNRVLAIPRRVACCIGVSDYSLALLRPHLPAGTPCCVVRNPVECRNEGVPPIGAGREFVYVGRFEREKGVLLFADAARSTGLPAKFVGAGALRDEAARLCPAGHFPGWQDAAAIRRTLRAARALVFPPLWHETLGLVVLEAAAAGVPAIVSDRCAATDFVRDGASGLHFARGSAQDLGRAMRELDQDPAKAARLGRAAYEKFWRDPWTVERHVDDLLEVYARAAGPRLQAAA